MALKRLRPSGPCTSNLVRIASFGERAGPGWALTMHASAPKAGH